MNAHWILILNKPASKEEYSGGGYRCSNCRRTPLNHTEDYPIHERYCHNCGAHMIEEPIIRVEEYDDYSL